MYKKHHRCSVMTLPLFKGKPIDVEWLQEFKNSLPKGHYARLRGRVPVKGEHYRNSYGSTTGSNRDLPLKHAKEADVYVYRDYRRV